MARQQPSERARLEVILEDMRSKLRAVAEGHSTLNRQIEEVRAELGQQIGLLEIAVSNGFRDVRAEIRDLRTRFEEHLSTHAA